MLNTFLQHILKMLLSSTVLGKAEAWKLLPFPKAMVLMLPFQFDMFGLQAWKYETSKYLNLKHPILIDGAICLVSG